MDVFQQNMINAMIESNRTIFYFDVVGEIDEDKFKKQFNTDNYFILKICKIEEIVLYLNRLYNEVDKNGSFDDLGIIVNDIRHFTSEYQNQMMSDKMLEMYMANYTKLFLAMIRDLAIKGVPVYMVGNTPKKDER
jgi:hypothetical protein